jgi:hypothetical protein
MKNKICIDKSHFIATIINIINVRSKLVYIKHLFVLETGEGSQGLTHASCPACTQVVDREFPLDRRLSDYNREDLIVDKRSLQLT